MIERRRKREIERILYKLQRRFGLPSQYCVFQSGTPNRKTGEPGADTKTIVDVRRTICFGVDVKQKFEYDLGYVAANKNFTYGAIYTAGDMFFLYRASDLPDEFNPKTQDYVIYQSRKYALNEWTELDAKAGYMFHCRQTKGTIPETIYNQYYTERLEFTQTTTVT